jgi:hypothetical protein
MRKTLVIVVLLALAVPLAGYAAARAGEGTLSVENGRGKVVVHAKGAIIGRLDRGTVVVYDLTPDDPFQPIVFGDDAPVRLIGENGLQYGGRDLRFRLIGGSYRFVVRGNGIDISAVGNGYAMLEGDPAGAGLYALDGSDCRVPSAGCKALPVLPTRVKLGSGDPR